MPRLTTEQWAQSHNISTAPSPPRVEDYDEPCPFTARQIGTRAIILQGVVAVASGVDPEPVVEWFRDQRIWKFVSPNEKELLNGPSTLSEEALNKFQWQVEAEWALLWVICKVETLGLPTHQCDTGRLVDEIIPELGSDIKPFLSSAKLRSPGLLLAEEDRHYDLWCRYHQDRRKNHRLIPKDLNVSVLFQRQYAFGWLNGIEAWDDVECDA